MTDIVTAGRIVVGVDGSEASSSALRWAAEQARALGAEVVAVHAWEPSAPGFAPYAPVAARPTAAAERDAAARRLADTLREVLGRRPDVAVRAELVEGPAARVLLERARGALLLALGRTPHEWGEAPVLGPVGRDCLRHASVPVVAVPVVPARTRAPLTVAATGPRARAPRTPAHAASR
ncbi:universal stress protein [Streptomyces sp. NPDC101213]|uniref:universal stress protein n=1 Tax=unclassified Streptomyces TaxID=2593676 RepID=UPI0036FEE464